MGGGYTRGAGPPPPQKSRNEWHRPPPHSFPAMAAVDRKRLSIQDFSPEMQDSLRALDLDGSGSVDSRELARAAEAYRSVQARAKRLNRMLAFGAVVLMLTLAAFSGLVFAVVDMTKESRVSESGVLMVKGSNETVKTSQVLNKSTMCSQLGDEIFRDMRYLEVTSPTGATVSLNILGWARMPEDHSLHGTVVVIVTQVGTVTIDGSELAFEDSVAPSSPRPASPCPPRAAASRASTRSPPS